MPIDKIPGDPWSAICWVEGCPSRILTIESGLCRAHYIRVQRHGDVQAHKPVRVVGLTPDQRLEFHLARKGPDECWPCVNAKPAPSGYCMISVGGKAILAHRFVYEQLVGPIPEGFTIDHTCHDPNECRLVERCPHRACVNPAHLEAVTHRENVVRAKRTHCKRGHLLAGDNLYANPNKRECRVCRSITRRERAA